MLSVPESEMKLPWGPWMGLCLLSFNLVSCDQVQLNQSNGDVDNLPRNRQQLQLKSAAEIVNSPSWTQFNVQRIEKRKVVSRKGVTQSSSSFEESDAAQKNTSSLVGKHPSVAGVESLSTSTMPQPLNGSLHANEIPNLSTLNNTTPSLEQPKTRTHATYVAVVSTKLATSPEGIETSLLYSQNDSTTALPLSSSTTITSRKKSKPKVTFDVQDLPRDGSGNIIGSSSDVVSSEPSVDFVVPVVLVLLTLPFLVVLGVHLFKKSRDFWERRHYRRMDFLIEGMYNE